MSIFKSDAFPRVLPFLIFIVFLMLESWIASGLSLQGFDPRWLYAVRSGLVILCLLFFWSKYTELKKVDSNRLSDWFLTLLIGIGVFVIWINLDQSWAKMGEDKLYDPFKAGTKEIDWLLLSFRIAGSALVVPIMEELFWRSFLMRWIEKPDFLSIKANQVAIRALAISAVIFALEHQLWLAGLIAGLAYGWLYIRTGNLWMVIVAHGITNGVLGIWVIQTGQWQFW